MCVIKTNGQINCKKLTTRYISRMTDLQKIDALLKERTLMISDLNRYKNTCSEMMTRLSNQEHEIDYLKDKLSNHTYVITKLRKEAAIEFEGRIQELQSENSKLKDIIINRE